MRQSIHETRNYLTSGAEGAFSDKYVPLFPPMSLYPTGGWTGSLPHGSDVRIRFSVENRSGNSASI